jgi:hypothetical protein
MCGFDSAEGWIARIILRLNYHYYFSYFILCIVIVSYSVYHKLGLLVRLRTLTNKQKLWLRLRLTLEVLTGVMLINGCKPARIRGFNLVLLVFFYVFHIFCILIVCTRLLNKSQYYVYMCSESTAAPFGNRF